MSIERTGSSGRVARMVFKGTPENGGRNVYFQIAENSSLRICINEADGWPVVNIYLPPDVAAELAKQINGEVS